MILSFFDVFSREKRKNPDTKFGKNLIGLGKIESRKFFQNSPNAGRFNLRMFRILFVRIPENAFAFVL